MPATKLPDPIAILLCKLYKDLTFASTVFIASSIRIRYMIYYVEDDANIRELALYALRQAEFETKGFSCADDFFEECSSQIPDLVLLDIMLPGKGGLEILREIRDDPAMANVPVMMLTAKGAEIDKVTGLDAGADDYLVKPFGMMELVSRVRALMRRAEKPASPCSGKLQCGSIVLDTLSRSVSADGVAVALTRKEFNLLQMLIENHGCVLTRDQLLRNVWGWEFAGNTRTVDVHIQTLRQKLEEASEESAAMIETVRGVGYFING